MATMAKQKRWWAQRRWPRARLHAGLSRIHHALRDADPELKALALLIALVEFLRALRGAG